MSRATPVGAVSDDPDRTSSCATAIGIITDELDADLARALDACDELGLRQVELRTIGGRSWIELSDRDFAAAVDLVRSRGFTLTVLASPIFKCALPGTAAEAGALHGAKAGATIEDSWRMLDVALERASTAEAQFLRLFSFWRIADPASVRDATIEVLEEALRRAALTPVELLLENEHDCNVATAAETAAILRYLPNLRIIWDPANHVRAGGDPVASGLPGAADRIAHVHVKDVAHDGSWTVVGTGLVPYPIVVDALRSAGYAGSFSLETHCRLDGSVTRAAEASLAALTTALVEAA